MASPAQIAANRLNAQKSTGPRSAEGKAATRFNALKHGADAASLIIPGEDPELLADLAAQFYAELRPQGAVETALVDTIIQATWNQRRFARIENQLYRALIAAQDPSDYSLGAAYLADAAGANALQKLFRRTQAAHSEWHKALTDLCRLQVERVSTQSHRPARVTQPEPPHAPQPTPPPPATTKPNPPQPAPARPDPASPPVPAAPPVRASRSGWLGSEPPAWRL